MCRRPLLHALTLALAFVALVVLPASAFAASPLASPSDTSTGPAACASARVEVSSATLRVARDATLCLLNRERSSRGLQPLRLDETLNGVAIAHSRDMVRRVYFQHEAPNGSSPFDRMLATRYVPDGARWLLGENIGWGTTELAQPAALVAAWMRSPSHRRNVLNGRFREIGVGIALGIPVGDPQLDGQPGATYTTNFGAVS